ncbi:hypothetical protein EC973_008615 [Apophysomyces ossiformis]|uniref:Uncharacterized protein n=1 Tax=Apophysomyces ossiformis TaxID=679940 RepID=A0A8H7BWN6_9FUNG|nr:hypothetical protein EC973_008615 [Apophysomyces ossiformis]
MISKLQTIALNSLAAPFVKRYTGLPTFHVDDEVHRLNRWNTSGRKKWKLLMNIRNVGTEKWRKAQGLNKLHCWLELQQARAIFRRLIHQQRRDSLNRFCDQMATGEYTKAIVRLSRIRKKNFNIFYQIGCPGLCWAFYKPVWNSTAYGQCRYLLTKNEYVSIMGEGEEALLRDVSQKL